MKNELAAEIRQSYEQKVKEACELCNTELDIAKHVYLAAKKAAKAKRDKTLDQISSQLIEADEGNDEQKV